MNTQKSNPVYRNFGFSISIVKMLESSGVETFFCYVTHPDYKKPDKSFFGEGKGQLNIYSDTDIDKVRFFASEWAHFYGIPLDEIEDGFTESHPESEDNKEFRLEEFGGIQ